MLPLAIALLKRRREAIGYFRDHGFVIAEDISGHGHKRYATINRDDIDSYVGPYNELIRVESLCKLYFDLDGPPQADRVDEVIAVVNARLFEQYGVQGGNVLVLCSSDKTKYSRLGKSLREKLYYY